MGADLFPPGWEKFSTRSSPGSACTATARAGPNRDRPPQVVARALLSRSPQMAVRVSATEIAWLVGGLLVFALIAGISYLVVVVLAGG